MSRSWKCAENSLTEQTSSQETPHKIKSNIALQEFKIVEEIVQSNLLEKDWIICIPENPSTLLLTWPVVSQHTNLFEILGGNSRKTFFLCTILHLGFIFNCTKIIVWHSVRPQFTEWLPLFIKSFSRAFCHKIFLKLYRVHNK